MNNFTDSFQPSDSLLPPESESEYRNLKEIIKDFITDNNQIKEFSEEHPDCLLETNGNNGKEVVCSVGANIVEDSAHSQSVEEGRGRIAEDESPEIHFLLFPLEASSTNPNENICNECGKSHEYQPNFEGVTTSIDYLVELLGKRTFRKWEAAN